ncbi:PH domain-containing protein [Rheinheimera sp.]|uniref:PH domain-containing protein n=1 Tax=Rheinheimera sp. TaxID=1869214 RepID=UPI003D2E2B4D
MANQLLDAAFIQDECLSAPLPQDWQHLPEAALGKRRWFWLGLTLVVLLALVALIVLSEGELALYAILGLVLLFGFLLQLWLPLQLTRTRFLLRRQDFLLESGVWWRQAVLIPLTRVQHVTVSQGPLQKQFGLATLKVFTAGGLQAEAALSDIDYELAQSLCQQLSQLIPQEERADAA